MVRRVSCVYGDLCINIDTNTGFQFNCDVVIPDSDLLDLASYQRFVKFSEVGSLLCNIILQVIDPLYLFVPCGGIDGGLLAEFSKTEYFIGNFVIGFFALGFLDELLLQLCKAFGEFSAHCLFEHTL